MNKKLLLLVLVFVLVGAGFYAYDIRHAAQAPTQTNSEQPSVQTAKNPVSALKHASYNSNSPSASTTAPARTVPTPQTRTGGENTGSDIQVYAIAYNGAAFVPNTQTIDKNDYVFFRNESDGGFQPQLVSGSLSNFNAGPISRGNEYKYQFTVPGNYIFNNKQNSSTLVTIIVQ